MVSRHPSGAIQLSDGRLIYADTPITAQDLAEVLPFLAPPQWPIAPGGGRGASAGGGGSAGPQGAMGAPGAQGPAGAAATGMAAQAIASVSAKDGSFLSQKGFEKSSKGSTGIYDLILFAPIPANEVVANVTLKPPHDGPGVNYIVSVGVHPSDGKSLRVKIVDPSMKPFDYDFMISVFRASK